ncbi:MAG: aldehyde ferredoxin oxidoreductase family protein [Spirochaetota bacterium]|nr:aldehyde ferredoxin oxidoreductase family protein [Spirochaetota bacterium]
MFGYHGKIVEVNLTTGSININNFDEDFARLYLGGNGFAAKILYDTVKPHTEPLSEDNVVVFATGPFTGGHVWGGSRGHCASISPLTNILCDSNFGGNFAAMFKRTAFDAIVIKGKASSPVYIHIDNEIVTIKDATSLWGKTVSETHSLLSKQNEKRIESALIGPAGENLVRYASVICSGTRVSAAGRGGIGAVLGSKLCKGIVVSGDKKIEIFDEDKLKNCLNQLYPGMKERAKHLTEFGTPVLVQMINSRGKLCTRNNQKEQFDKAYVISGEYIKEHHKKKNIACHGCPVACGKLVDVPYGTYTGTNVKMPEYETIYAIGSMLENSDVVSIYNANTVCDEMGMDTISFGVTLAFLTECVEKGLIKNSDLEIPLHFGKWNHLAEIAEYAAYQKGLLGKLLAMGSRRLSEYIGGESYKYLYEVKGLEIAGHSARGLRQMSLGYATATRGGSHHDTRPTYYPNDPEVDPGFTHQPEYSFNSQNNTAIGDSLVICRFIHERSFGTQINETLAEALSYVTGWDITKQELVEIGERIYTLERLINVSRGIDRQSDVLPYRVMNEPIPDGPSKGWMCTNEDLQKMLDEYYRLRGWDKNGIPTKETLKRLKIY